MTSWSDLWNILQLLLTTVALPMVLQQIIKATKRWELEKARRIVSEVVIAGKDLVVLPGKQVLEKGYVIVTSTNPEKCYDCIKWKSLGLRYEASAISAADACFDATSVVKRGGENLKIVMPGVIAKRGKCAGLIVSCFSTRVGRTSLKESLARGDEYAVSELHYGAEFIEVSLNWVVVNSATSTGNRRRALIMSICGDIGGKQECVKVLELRKPGYTKARYRIPKIGELVVMHKSGYGVERLAELIRDVPEHFLAKNPTIKLSTRKFVSPRLLLRTLLL